MESRLSHRGDYNYSYYPLTPQNLAFAALAKGVVTPGLEAEPLRVLELGCGQGFSANLIAAANPHLDYTAIDFNPGHIASARALAGAAGVRNVHFRSSLHGIYSWVSVENQRISFGSTARLFAEVAAGAPQEPVDFRIDQSFKVFRLLCDMGARYLDVNPGVVARFKQMEELPRNYLAHECELDDIPLRRRQPRSFPGQAPARRARQQHILNQVRDPVRKESLRDLIVNQAFRRDIYIKGHLSAGDEFSRVLARSALCAAVSRGRHSA